jgi:hypothetical protein
VQPDNGWLHANEALAVGHGIVYSFPAHFIGSVAILESLQVVDDDMKNAICFEAIARCAYVGLQLVGLQLVGLPLAHGAVTMQGSGEDSQAKQATRPQGVQALSLGLEQRDCVDGLSAIIQLD